MPCVWTDVSMHRDPIFGLTLDVSLYLKILGFIETPTPGHALEPDTLTCTHVT